MTAGIEGAAILRLRVRLRLRLRVEHIRRSRRIHSASFRV
jgi:hypothetical protein